MKNCFIGGGKMYKELNKGIQEFGYEIFGLRKDDLEYKIGDILPNSHQLYQDPQYTDFTCTELYIHT